MPLFFWSFGIMAKSQIQGVRIYPKEDGTISFKEGEYGKDNRGVWRARPPGGHLGDLSGHEVEEHEDGTITVSPSILIDDGRTQWHGYLRRGLWLEC